MANIIEEKKKARKEDEEASKKDDQESRSSSNVGMLDEVTIRGRTLLEQYLQEQSDIRRQAREAEIENTDLFNQQLYAAEVAQAERMTRLYEQGYKGRMMIAKDFFGSIGSLMQSENRKMFEVGKAASIANTVISTIESAQKSFNAMAGIPVVGPALGAAAAAAAIAGGVARVQQIQSTTMGGGGSLGGGGGVAGSGAGIDSTVQENVIDATFNIQSESGQVGTEQIRSIAAGLNELTEDGGKIRSVKVL